MNRKHTAIFTLVIRLILGGVFLYAAAGKIAEPAQFADDIAAYRLLPVYLVNLLAIVLPYVELSTGAGLLFGRWQGAFSLLAAGLMLMFTVAAMSAMARGLSIECGCFTLSGHGKVSWGLIARNAVLLSMALALFKCRKREKALNPTGKLNLTS